MKKNILLVNYSLELGGIERLLLEFCRELNKQDQFTLHMLVFSPLLGIKNEFEKENIHIIVLNKKPGVNFRLVPKIIKLIKELDIDIIHSHAQNTWFYSAIAALITKKPIISTIHSGNYKYQTMQKYRWNLLSLILSFITNKITTVGKHLQQDLLKLGVKQSKIINIYNGINYKKFEINTTKEVENALIIVARLCFQKNHLILFEAINIVRKKIPEIKLYVVGDGELFKELNLYIEKHHLSNNIIMMGQRNDINHLLHSKSIFILPSIIEGLPISLLEAMTSKRAIIASNIPANTEVVTDNQHALIVNPYDSQDIANKITTLYNDKLLQKRLAVHSYEHVKKHFSFHTMTEKYIDLYKEFTK